MICKHLTVFEKITSTTKLEDWPNDFAPEHSKEALAAETPVLNFQSLEAIRGGEAAPVKTEALQRQDHHDSFACAAIRDWLKHDGAVQKPHDHFHRLIQQGLLRPFS